MRARQEAMDREAQVFVDQRARNVQRRKQMIVVFSIIGLTLVGLVFRAGSVESARLSAEGASLDPLPGVVLLKDRATTYPVPANAFRIGIVADKDRDSKYGDLWHSVLRSGLLVRKDNGEYTIDWEEDMYLTSMLNEAGRGLELSELIYWNDMLLTCDDRTGAVFEIKNGQAVPRYIVMDGNGDNTKGFKCEWMATKDGKLYVGSMGKEWTTPEGEIVNNNPQWVKVISADDSVEHMDWKDVYNGIKRELEISSVGYVLHESCNWNEHDQKWYFLPRRVSNEQYNDALDERRGHNTMITANVDFSSFDHRTVGPLIESHGFSSFKFVPDRPDEIVAVKSEEDGANINSYITVFRVDGTILMPETKILGTKFEGVEFLKY